MTQYDRPHLSFAEQVALMEDRGLDCSGCDAQQALARIGYYRLSAYTHPLREFLPEGALPESPYHYRTEMFRPGYKLTDALALYDFDQGLRAICMEALKTVEVGLRVQVAYVLGKRDTFGHLNQSSLDPRSCGRRAPDERYVNMFDFWRSKYRSLEASMTDDFFRHYYIKYGGRLPVWIAVEALDFGHLVRLYGLMDDKDKNAISRAWGVFEGSRFHKWLMALNALRNHCAHHSRLWNRNLTHEIQRFPPATVGPELDHVAVYPHRKKVYVLLAILAYLIVRVDSRSNWPHSLKSRVASTFPTIPEISPVSDMGFPDKWLEERLWQDRDKLDDSLSIS